MISPYFAYIFAFVLGLLTYQLDWSNIYPTLNPLLILFIATTFVVASYLGISIKNDPRLEYHVANYIPSFKITLASYFFWALEMAYCQVIPIVKILRGDSYLYTDFEGIPSLHVIVYAFQIFFCTYLFHLYLCKKTKSTLCIYILNVMPFALIFSRGGLTMVIISCFFVYILSVSYTLNIARLLNILLLKLVPFCMLFLLLFGALGNVRSTSQLDDSDAGNSLILQVGEATPKFYSSGVPAELYWGYLYISSPIANLQENINSVTAKNIQVDFNHFISFISNEILPDFISKRVNEVFGISRTGYSLIIPALTVSTVYAGSYSHLSWIGIILMAIFTMGFPKWYIPLLSVDNPLRVSGIAVLNSIYLLLLFDNMFRVSGMILPLIYPILLARFCKQKQSIS